jgi:FkbM family methyltransferase
MKPEIVDRIKQLANRLGYDVVPLWRVPHARFAEHLSRLFELLAVDCVFDVGANRGQYRDFLRHHVRYTGQIFSFEPIPEIFSELQARAESDRLWQVFSCAVGMVEGKASFNKMSHGEFGSFLTPDHSHVSIFHDLNRVEAHISVEVKTLASLLPELRAQKGIKRPYLKMDTQGYDLNVIRGAGAALSAFVGLQTEAAVRPIYQGAPLFNEVFQELEERGFVLSGIFPNNAGHFPVLIEFEAVFFNSALSSDATVIRPKT